MPCSPVWVGEFKQHSISFSAVNILLSITAALGNSLILVTLHKESSLHPPSKLLYHCLATTDLLIGFVTQPIYLCFTNTGVFIDTQGTQSSYQAVYLCGVSLLTMTAISMDRTLAGSEIQRDFNFKTHVSHFSYCLDCMSSR